VWSFQISLNPTRLDLVRHEWKSSQKRTSFRSVEPDQEATDHRGCQLTRRDRCLELMRKPLAFWSQLGGC
jgi:hypothetical protein